MLLVNFMTGEVMLEDEKSGRFNPHGHKATVSIKEVHFGYSYYAAAS